eukprot:8288205-Pyramimonas_sp.AAC.1
MWISPEELSFDLRDCDPERLIDFGLGGSLDAQVWSKASQHHLGKGLEFSADFTVPYRHMKRLEGRNQWDRAAVLRM